MIGLVLLYVVFSIHHAYGAAVYDTPARLAGIAPLGVLLALTLALLRVIVRTHSRLARGLFVVLVVVVWLGAVAVIEGGYNHTLKVVLYLAGVPIQDLPALFGSQDLVAPNNALFEGTGVLEFLLGLPIAWNLRRLLRERPRDDRGVAVSQRTAT